MPKNRIIIVIGVLVALLPILGFPKAWESFFQIVAGLSIIFISVWATIDKKLMLKHKAHMRQNRQTDAPGEPEHKSVSRMSDALQSFSKRVTDFYPKTAPPGRRISDMNPTITPEPEEPTQQ